jgi:hypothetical protein
MLRKKPDVDVIQEILNDFIAIYPESVFVKGLLQQYNERGGLSKKQLEGLYAKAVEIKKIAPNKLATLEAEIKKRPSRFKSAAPPPAPLYTRDERVGELLNAILEKYPAHKRILFLKSRYDNNENLSAVEVTELEKLAKLLLK